MDYNLCKFFFFFSILSFLSPLYSPPPIIRSAQVCTNYLLHLMKTGAHYTSPHNCTQTLLDHSLQTAYYMQKSTHQKSTVLAALFNDLGYLIPYTLPECQDSQTIVEPHILSACLLKDLGISRDVTTLIHKFPEAQRYTGIVKNGTPMTVQEKIQFKQLPYFATLIELVNCNLKGILLPQSNLELCYYKKPIEDYLLDYYSNNPELTQLPFITYLRNKPQRLKSRGFD